MLVLSRQKDESIMIGDNVEITIVDVRGDKVRLGITAPKEIPVHRREVFDAIQREKITKCPACSSRLVGSDKYLKSIRCSSCDWKLKDDTELYEADLENNEQRCADREKKTE